MSVFIQQMNVVTMFWHKRQSLSDDLVGSLFFFLFQVESGISLHHFGTGIMQLEVYNEL